jgi:hypothetical protein
MGEKLMRLSISAGESQTVTIQGGRCYYENGEGRINFRMVGGGDSRDFNLYAGQGFVCNEGERFYALEIKNIELFDQDIEFEISDREVFDNRARIVATSDVLPVEVTAGSIDIGGLLSIVNQGGLYVEHSKLALLAGVPKLVMPNDVARLKASLYFDVPVSLGGDASVTVGTGYPLTAGSDWGHENVGELWAISASAGNVYIIEDKK